MPKMYFGSELNVEEFINIEKYPIHFINSSEYQKLVVRSRQLLNDDGCCLITNFLTDEAVTQMIEEANQLEHLGYRATDLHNPYFTVSDAQYDKSDPRGYFSARTSAYITTDKLTEQSVLFKFYSSDIVINFIKDCIDDGAYYRWADPIASVPYSVMGDGDYFPWHFDSNEYTVSLLAQNAEEGGIFEYCPYIRSAGNENYVAVQSVLEGDHSKVKRLELKSGDLQLFKGRNSLHRVTQTKGSRKRVIALPSYVKDPYRVNMPYHSECLYGTSLPIHQLRLVIPEDGLTG